MKSGIFALFDRRLHGNSKRANSYLSIILDFVCLICGFNVPVNNYGNVQTVS